MSHQVLESDGELHCESVDVADEVQPEEDHVELLQELLAVVLGDFFDEPLSGVGLLVASEAGELDVDVLQFRQRDPEALEGADDEICCDVRDSAAPSPLP